MVSSTVSEDPDALLALARQGDQRAYDRLIKGHLPELHAHCYRILASVDDADDALQDTLLRAWRALPRFEARSSLRTWLYTIATNAAFDVSNRRTRRELPIAYEEFVESNPDVDDLAWVEPYPDRLLDRTATPEARYDARESLELAFVASLQHLTSPQRAALLLREVLAFSAQETAAILGTTEPAVNSALQRARRNLSGRLPESSQQAELARLGEPATRELAGRYARAIETADVPLLLDLLAEDATWVMPPMANRFQGRRAISAFHQQYVMTERWQHRMCTVNGQVAVAAFLYDPARIVYAGAALDVLSFRGPHVVAISSFLGSAALDAEDRARYGRFPSPDFERFGLPTTLPPEV
jgi:RNA polymerase sigma-70 factor (ECF subfamily)